MAPHNSPRYPSARRTALTKFVDLRICDRYQSLCDRYQLLCDSGYKFVIVIRESSIGLGKWYRGGCYDDVIS